MNTITKFAIASGIIIAIIITSQADNHGLLLFSSNGPNNAIKTNIDNSLSKTLRIGYFPNVNHAQAIIGLKNGDFQRILNSNDRQVILNKIKLRLMNLFSVMVHQLWRLYLEAK